MSGWNNGLYNIWQTDVAPLLKLKLKLTPTPSAGAPTGRRESADEAGLRAAQQRWSEAFVFGDKRARRPARRRLCLGQRRGAGPHQTGRDRRGPTWTFSRAVGTKLAGLEGGQPE